MTTLYNEHDQFAAEWLRRLVAAGHIAGGTVDERDIRELLPGDLRGVDRFHAFAGIAGWDLALRLAGWPDDAPIWTGSCPCQPFSAAGRRCGTADERHLWPAWFALIRECRPPIVVGEQVASADGLGWLDAVFADLEDEGYACGAADLCAAGVGAPHLRQRLWFVAYDTGRGWGQGCADGGWSVGGTSAQGRGKRPSDDGSAHGLAHADAAGRSKQRSRRLPADGDASQRHDADGRGEALRLGDAGGAGLARWQREPGDDGAQREAAERAGDHAGGLADPERGGRQSGRQRPATPTTDLFAAHRVARGPWSDPDWIRCRDGVSRPVEPGTFPLAHGLPGRVGRLRGYGNAIVPQVAATFVRAVMEAR